MREVLVNQENNATSVFIVEDELLISENIRSMLEDDGFIITGSAISGEECLEKLDILSMENKEPDIVLMDINLHGPMNGIDAAEVIMHKFQCGIIFLTGQSSREIYDRSFKLRPFGYLFKPIDIHQTRMTIEVAAYQRNLEIQNKKYRRALEAVLDEKARKLNDVQQLYQAIVENSLLGILIFYRGEVLFANQEAAAMFDLSLQELYASTSSDLVSLVHPSDKEFVLSRLNTRLLGSAVSPISEFRLLTNQGREKWIHTYVKMISLEKKKVVFGTMADVTEKKKDELELIKYLGELEKTIQGYKTKLKTLEHENF